jgi:hypothetical protein
MLAFAADRPFAYRVLMPLLIRGIDAATPFWTVDAAMFEQRDAYRRLRLERGTEKRQLIAAALLLCSLLGTLYAARRVSKLVYPRMPDLAADLAPAVAVVFLPLTFIRGGYMYDFPELFFLFATLLALLKSRWWWYYALYALAVLNKESNVLVVLFFAAVGPLALSARQLRKHLILHMFVAGPLLASTRIAFAQHPGAQMENRLMQNIDFFLSPGSYFQFFEIYAPFVPVPRGFNIITMCAVAFLVACAWRRLPVVVRRLFFLVSLVAIPLYLVGSHTDEIRSLSLLFPALYLVAVHSVCSLYTHAERSSASPDDRF